MKQNLLFSLILSLSFSASATSEHGQTLPGQDPDYSAFLEQMKTVEGDEHLLMGDRDSEVGDEDGSTYSIPGGVTDPVPMKSGERFNITAPGTFDKDEEYLEIDKSQFVKNFSRRGKWNFGVSYINDDFDYSDPGSIFQKTYLESTGSVKGGVLQLSVSKYFTRNWVYLSFGVNAGVGYNNGKGIFVDNTQSNANFTLWTLPLDFSLSVDIPVTPYFQISGTGGPSVMGLIQNRSDRDTGEKNKQRRQVSHGYFYGAKFKLSLSRLFRESAINMYSHYDVTNYFLTLESRFQNYENFQDELSISGMSYGIGFTFEFI